jgi:hypothetical protein
MFSHNNLTKRKRDLRRLSRYKYKDFERLKITAYLSTPAIINGMMNFEGILTHLVYRYRYGPDYYNTKGKMYEQGDWKKNMSIFLDLPLKKERGVYLSSNVLKQSTQSITKWRKRFKNKRAEKWLKSTRVIDTSRHKYKNYDIPQILDLTEKLEWVVIGNKEAIENLLRFCPTVGKKSSQGYGLVNEWKVELTEEKGKRYFPDNSSKRFEIIRAPYFKNQNQKASLREI